jgi:MFS family permease
MIMPAKTRWGIVALAVGAGIVAAAHVGKLPPALSALRADLGLSLVAGGWVVSMFSVTGMVVAILAGTVADRVGHWRLVLAGLASLLIGSTLGAFAGGEAVLLFSRFLEGLGFISVAVSVPSVILRAAVPGDRRLALGLWGAYMPAGTALMMVASPAVLALAGWRVLWGAAAALALLWMAAMLVGGRAAPRDRLAGPGGSAIGNIRLSAAQPGTWLLALCFALYTIPWLALMVWLPSFMIETRGIGTAAAATLTALVVAMNVPGNLTAGWLLHRGARHWALIAVAAGVMGLCSLGIFAAALPDLLRYTLCLVFSLVGGMLPTAVLSGAPVFAPGLGQVGTTNGMLVQGSNTGQVIGPPAVAAAVQAAGNWEAAGILMLATCFGATLAALALRPIERRRPTYDGTD